MICRTCPLINEALHHHAGRKGLSKIERVLYWVWAKSTIFVFQRSKQLWKRKWGNFLKQNGVEANSYSLQRFDRKFTMYLKLSINHTKSYVGSTKVGMLKREANRRRHFAARAREKKSEPAFQWWARTDSFWEFCPVVVRVCPTRKAALRAEKATQSIRRPELNAPWVWQLIGSPAKKLSQPFKPFLSQAKRKAAAGSWDSNTPAKWRCIRNNTAWDALTELAQKGNQSNQRIKWFASEKCAQQSFSTTL